MKTPEMDDRNFSSQFASSLQNSNLIKKNDRILLALSGGKDSVCLFHLLLEHRDRLAFQFSACHVHHGIRGDEADRDLSFCEALCKQYGVPFYSSQVSVPEFCKKEKIGTEEGARILRYRALENVAKKHGFTAIATAHTASDQAETVLFRMIRGTGVVGCRGILKRNGRIIRPLLPFTSEEILAYLKRNHRLFTSDSSNTDTIYARNHIRHQILPQLEKIHPGAMKALCRFSDNAGNVELLCDSLCKRIEDKEGFSFSSGVAPISALRLLSQDPAGTPVLHYALSKMTQHKIPIHSERFSAIASLLNRNSSGKIIEIQNGYSFSFQKKNLVFTKLEASRPVSQYSVFLKEGDNDLSEISATLTVSGKKRGKAENINKNLLIIHLSSDKIEGMMFARSFLPGDRIIIQRMTKSVKKLLCDAGFSTEQRKIIPMICDREGILWIPGIGLSDRARPEDAENHCTLSLKYSIHNDHII